MTTLMCKEITKETMKASATHEISPMLQDQPLPMATKRVLIIDDEPDVRAVVQGCLEELGGWNVVTAASGHEGLAKVMAEQPDGIVLDVMMPGMDGFAFLRELRKRPEGRSIPVVLLTAKINPTDPQVLLELRIKGIISKPFDPFTLSDQIAYCLGWEIETY
ncbi:response regulator [[Phormidium ambiguum] IAM M-71]|nr:response regulator [Phormidium ambiguum]